MIHELAHCHDEAANHQLPIAAAFFFFLNEGNSHQEDYLKARDLDSSNSKPSGSIPLSNPDSII